VRTYILKRLLLMIPTLIGITLLTYLIVRLAPGDAIEALIRNQSGNIDPRAMKESADLMRERLGLKDYNLWGRSSDEVVTEIDKLESGTDAERTAAAARLKTLTGVDVNASYDVWKAWREWRVASWGPDAREEAAGRTLAMTGVDVREIPEWTDWADAGAAAALAWSERLRPQVNDLLRPRPETREAAAKELTRETGLDFSRNSFAWKAWWVRNQSTYEKSLIDPAEKFLSAVAGYGLWVSHLCVGDFGESAKFTTSSGSRSPLKLIIERIPVTATLNLISEALVFLIAIPVGLMAARHQGKWLDRLPSFVMLVLWSIPYILAGTLMIGYLCRGGSGLKLFPIAGLHSFEREGSYIVDLLWHATLPVVCLTYGGFAYLAKMGRASLLENLRADYVRTARAKGLPERRVIYHHALRNSLLPMITVMVLMIPGLIGGSVVVEKIFSIQGTGILLVDAATAFDLSVIMADTLLYGMLTLVFLLIGDILYAVADPRVRYD
jgi:peptide/nickel transport system permease protein